MCTTEPQATSGGKRENGPRTALPHHVTRVCGLHDSIAHGARLKDPDPLPYTNTSCWSQRFLKMIPMMAATLTR